MRQCFDWGTSGGRPAAALLAVLAALLLGCGLDSRLCQRVVACEADGSSAHRRYCNEAQLAALEGYDAWDWECVAEAYERASCSAVQDLDRFYRTNAVCHEGTPEPMTSAARELAATFRACERPPGP